MNSIEARKLALQKMAYFGLTPETGWRFRFSVARHNCGKCYSNKIIELAMWYVEANDERHVLDTILHEIAHALVGPSHGHDDTWKAKAAELGATPEALAGPDTVTFKRATWWQGHCPVHGELAHCRRRREPTGVWLCTQCHQEARVPITWLRERNQAIVEENELKRRKGRSQ